MDTNIKRIWAQKHFNYWLLDLSAAKAFGVKVTGARMRSIGGFVTTVRDTSHSGVEACLFGEESGYVNDLMKKTRKSNSRIKS